jgi:hypothetical protein
MSCNPTKIKKMTIFENRLEIGNNIYKTKIKKNNGYFFVEFQKIEEIEELTEEDNYEKYVIEV